jgi:polar amino acid transport system substrate-binding protein
MQFQKLIQVAIIALAITSHQAVARNVTMVSVEWAPHYGTGLPENGLTTALVKAAFEAGGHDASIEFIPWERALKEVDQGKYDIVMGAYSNSERSAKYHMSDEIYKLELGIIARPGLDLSAYKSLRELSPYTIGVSRGYANSEEFDSASYLNKEVATHPILNIRKLYRGRIDMAVMNLDLFRYNAKKEGFCVSHIEFVRPVLGQNGLHIMGSRNVADGSRIIEDFNRGLEAIKSNGEFDQIVSRFRN